MWSSSLWSLFLVLRFFVSISSEYRIIFLLRLLFLKNLKIFFKIRVPNFICWKVWSSYCWVLILRFMSPCSLLSWYKRFSGTSVCSAFTSSLIKKTAHSLETLVFTLKNTWRDKSEKMTWIVYVCVHYNLQKLGFRRFFNDEGKIQHFGHEP